MKRQITTDRASRAGGPYSQAIEAGNLVFTVTGKAPEGIEAQTERTVMNLAAILEAAGCSRSDVVKTTVHLADLADFQRFNAVDERHFPEPGPARTTVGSQLLGILVEIDAVAVTPS